MNSRERAIQYQHPPHINHQEAGEDLIALLDEHAAEQRQMCADAIDAADDENTALGFRSLNAFAWDNIVEACINAKGGE